MIEIRCMQLWNSQVIVFSKHGIFNLYTHYRAYQIKLWPKLINFKGNNWRYNVNDI